MYSLHILSNKISIFYLKKKKKLSEFQGLSFTSKANYNWIDVFIRWIIIQYLELDKVVWSWLFVMTATL